MIKIYFLYALLMFFFFSNIYSEDLVSFNTEEVIFHESIPSLLKASPEELLAEPSMKQATADFAWKNGGPITKDILNNFRKILSEEDYRNITVDTKIQLFKNNEYSNTPGWHCDFLVHRMNKKKGLSERIQV